jgi:hypothetical protein
MRLRSANRRALAIVLAATAASFLYFCLEHRHFTLLTYPFKFPDSWAWLVEALWYLGEDVIPAVLAPVTPLTFAGLIELGWANVIPYRGIFFHHAMIPAVYILTRAGTGSCLTALLASLLCLTSSALLGNALYVGSDVAANALLVYAVLFFWLGVTRSNRYLWLAGACTGVSALTQYAAFFLPLSVLGYLLLCDRRRLRHPVTWGSLVLAGLLAGSQFIYRWLTFGAPLYSRAQHVGLLRFHLDDIGPYAWWTIGFFSLPVLLLALLGTWEVLSRASLRKFGILLLLIIATMGVFFVLLYDWPDNRFIQYWAIPVLILTAIGLRRCYTDLALTEPQQTDRPPVGAGDSSSRLAPLPVPAATRWRARLAFLGVAGGVILAGSLSRLYPFSNEVVLLPGLAISVDPLLTGGEPAPRPITFRADYSLPRYNVFYYSHARRLRAYRNHQRPIPCTFNDATAQFEPLTPVIRDQLPAGSVVALQPEAAHSASWHRYTLSFLTRRAGVFWNEQAGGDSADRPVGIVVVPNDKMSHIDLVSSTDPTEVLTVAPGEKMRQQMVLPDGVIGLSLLTGTFDQPVVAVRYVLSRGEQPDKPIADGSVTLRNNDYTFVPPLLLSSALVAGTYELIVENRDSQPAAFYVNRTWQADGWVLTGPDERPAAGSLQVRAQVPDAKLASAFVKVFQTDQYSVWLRSSDSRSSSSQTLH